MPPPRRQLASVRSAECKKGCGWSAFGGFETCCTACSGPEGPHSKDCNMKNRRLRPACTNQCGRPAFGKFGTCCTRCKSSSGPHKSDCATKCAVQHAAARGASDIPSLVSVRGACHVSSVSLPADGVAKRDSTTYYRIDVHADAPFRPWSVNHRYNEFLDLCEQLGCTADQYPDAPFPPKLLLCSAEKLETRRRGLEAWLNAALQERARSGVSRQASLNRQINRFLETAHQRPIEQPAPVSAAPYGFASDATALRASTDLSAGSSPQIPRSPPPLPPPSSMLLPIDSDCPRGDILQLVVPDGVAPGQMLLVAVPDGRELPLTVPAGAEPGSLIEVTHEPRATSLCDVRLV